VVKEVAKVEAVLDIDLSSVELEVDLADPDVDLAEASEEAQAEVKTFASDVAEGYETAVAESLGVDTDSVKVTCIYREADSDKLDILTLEKTCDGRRLGEKDAARRLEGSGLGIQVEMIDDAQRAVKELIEADPETGGASALAAKLSDTPVIVESELLSAPISAAVTGVAEPEVVRMRVEVEVDDTTSPEPPPPSGTVESAAFVRGFLAVVGVALFI
jgi:hypothetical protein